MKITDAPVSAARRVQHLCTAAAISSDRKLRRLTEYTHKQQRSELLRDQNIRSQHSSTEGTAHREYSHSSGTIPTQFAPSETLPHEGKEKVFRIFPHIILYLSVIDLPSIDAFITITIEPTLALFLFIELHDWLPVRHSTQPGPRSVGGRLDSRCQ